MVFGPEPTNIALSNSWIVTNAGGGPTDDKPTVTLETPRDDRNGEDHGPAGGLVARSLAIQHAGREARVNAGGRRQESGACPQTPPSGRCVDIQSLTLAGAEGTAGVGIPRSTRSERRRKPQYRA